MGGIPCFGQYRPLLVLLSADSEGDVHHPLPSADTHFPEWQRHACLPDGLCGRHPAAGHRKQCVWGIERDGGEILKEKS